MENTHSIQWFICFQPNQSVSTLQCNYYSTSINVMPMQAMKKRNTEMLSAKTQYSHAPGFLAFISLTVSFRLPRFLANSYSSFKT